jgi:hypothetical protein
VTASPRPLDLDHPGLQRFLMANSADDVEESGMQQITSSAFAVCEHGQVVAAVKLPDWPCGAAHLSVLTAAAARGRGLARALRQRPSPTRSGRKAAAMAGTA